MRAPASVTGRFLATPLQHPLHARRPVGNTDPAVTVAGARLHNLKDLHFRTPLGRLAVVTGVSALMLVALDVKPGMVIADIGAGTGYHARRLARRTGSKGLVYAVEVQPGMMALLEQHLARHLATNVKAILGTVTDPRLPAESLDLAVMIDVYHERCWRRSCAR